MTSRTLLVPSARSHAGGTRIIWSGAIRSFDSVWDQQRHSLAESLSERVVVHTGPAVQDPAFSCLPAPHTMVGKFPQPPSVNYFVPLSDTGPRSHQWGPPSVNSHPLVMLRCDPVSSKFWRVCTAIRTLRLTSSSLRTGRRRRPFIRGYRRRSRQFSCQAPGRPAHCGAKFPAPSRPRAWSLL